MTRGEIRIGYGNGEKTRPLILKEIVLTVMKNMPFVTKKDFIDREDLECDINQAWPNDFFVDKVVTYINKHFRLSDEELTEDNMSHDKWRNWKDFKGQIHVDFSYWSGKGDFILWRTYKHPIYGKVKVRLDKSKTPPHLYDALFIQEHERELERMRMIDYRGRIYLELTGNKSRFLGKDQKWISGTEEEINGGG